MKERFDEELRKRAVDCKAPKAKGNQQAKADEGKLQLSLVPTQIIRDIAEVRMYGNKKYGDPNNWKQVEKQRYVDALLRHLLLYLDDPDGVDAESGIPHYKHMACNMAFICAMEADFSKKMNPPEELYFQEAEPILYEDDLYDGVRLTEVKGD